MATPHSTFRRIALLVAALAITVPLFAASAGGATAAPVVLPAVSSAAASPTSFVANWDGETDSTDITYRVDTRSTVTVAVLDARGRVRVVLERATRATGSYGVSWDGRDGRGVVLPDGTYRVRVSAAPVGAAAPARVGGVATAAAARSGARLVRARRDVAVVLRQPDVAVRAVRLTRGAIGRAKSLGATRASYVLTTPAFVNAAIVDASGHVWRTLATGRRAKGAQAAAWGGYDAAGRPVPDGMYDVLVAASSGGKPTTTLRVPIRVDRTLPTLTAPKTLRAAISSGDAVLPLDVAVDEASTLRIKVGSRGVKVAAAAGTRRFSIRGTTLGIVPGKRPRVVPVFVSATDATGNVRAARVAVTVPAVVHASRPPAAPPKTTRPSGPGVATGRFAWPVAMPITITSPFGRRWGANHNGIDIGKDRGTPIHAAAAGRASYVGPMDGYGNVVIVDHPNSVQTYYAHMDATAAGLVVGDAVDVGTLLGVVGCTGHCTGDHLHFEVRVGGVARDPMQYLPAP